MANRPRLATHSGIVPIVAGLVRGLLTILNFNDVQGSIVKNATLPHGLIRYGVNIERTERWINKIWYDVFQQLRVLGFLTVVLTPPSSTSCIAQLEVRQNGLEIN